MPPSSRASCRLCPRTHTGNFILYPSASYGAWLSTASGRMLGDEGVIDYIHRLGGSLQALARAFGFKAAISGFKQLQPAGLREFRVLAGSGNRDDRRGRRVRGRQSGRSLLRER